MLGGQISKMLVTMNTSLPATGHSSSPEQMHLTFWALISDVEKKDMSLLHKD